MTTQPTIMSIGLLLLCHTVLGQSPINGILDRICETTDVVESAEYERNSSEYADDFCVLAMHEPNKARLQLNKMIRTTRAAENPNRYYFSRKRGEKAGYIQLLRPWMAEENTSGTARWRVTQDEPKAVYNGGFGYYYHYAYIVDWENPYAPCRAIRIGFDDGSIRWKFDGDPQEDFPDYGMPLKLVSLRPGYEWNVRTARWQESQGRLHAVWMRVPLPRLPNFDIRNPPTDVQFKQELEDWLDEFEACTE